MSDELVPQYDAEASMIEPVRYLVVHCADTTPNQNIDITDVRRWHMKERGWLSEGYHYFVKRDGTIQTGRPLRKQGAHVKGYNESSIGLCMAGGSRLHAGHMIEDNNFTQNQWLALRALLWSLRVKYPRAEILGHRDFPGVKKYCPSFDVRDWLRRNPLPRTPNQLGL